MNTRKFAVKIVTAIIVLAMSFGYTSCGKSDAQAQQPKQAQTEQAQASDQQPEQVAEQAQASEQQPEQAAEQAQASEQQPEQAAEQAQASDQQPEQAAEQAQASDQQPEQVAEQAQASDQQPEQAAEQAQPSEEAKPTEEERLTAYIEWLEGVDTSKVDLIEELLRVKNEEEDYSYQQAVINRLLKEKTSQKSPATVGEYPIVRVFNHFVLLGEDGRILVYEDERHLHFMGDEWKDLKRNGSVTFEDNAVIWRTDGVRPQWCLAEYNGTRYLFYKLTWDDVNAGDSVFSSYDKQVRQKTKSVVKAIKEEGKVSQKNFNILESIAFLTARKPVSSEEYCIVQYYTREECAKYDLSGRTLINLKFDENGELKKVDTSSPSLIILEEDLGIKVTIVTEETEEGVQFEETNK